MSNDDALGCFCAFILVAVFVGSGFSIGIKVDPGTEVRRQAVEAGVARWTIDEQTGEKQFEWIKPGESK